MNHKRLLRAFRPETFSSAAQTQLWVRKFSRTLSRYAPRYSEACRETQRQFSKWEADAPSSLHPHDWRRFEAILPLVAPSSVLDIGTWNGAFLHIIQRLGEFKRLGALDDIDRDNLRLPEFCEFSKVDVVEMDYPDEAWDTTVMMEVLEHIPPDRVELALQSVRRVTKKRAIYTLPYREPEPVYMHDSPRGHKQSFDGKKLFHLFPKAFFTLIPVSAIRSVVLIIEDKSLVSHYHKFKLSSLQAILDLFSAKTPSAEK